MGGDVQGCSWRKQDWRHIQIRQKHTYKGAGLTSQRWVYTVESCWLSHTWARLPPMYYRCLEATQHRSIWGINKSRPKRWWSRHWSGHPTGLCNDISIQFFSSVFISSSGCCFLHAQWRINLNLYFRVCPPTWDNVAYVTVTGKKKRYILVSGTFFNPLLGRYSVW